MMPSSTFGWANWKEAKQITPQTVPSLSSDFKLYPEFFPFIFNIRKNKLLHWQLVKLLRI